MFVKPAAMRCRTEPLDRQTGGDLVSLVSIRHARRAAGALAAVTMIAGFAHRGDAQLRTWDDYCTTGSLKMCLSVDLSLNTVLINGNPFTLATVTLQNLEGSLGSTPWGIDGVTFGGLAPVVPMSPGVHAFPLSSPTFEGNAQNHGVPPQMLNGFWLWIILQNNTLLFDRETQTGDGGFPIGGCDPLTPNPEFGPNHSEIGYFSTCGDAAIQYNVLLPQVTFTDATSLSLTGFVDQPTQSFSCTFNVDCVQVTPEPSTFALVGGGLVAVAAFERRRRRRRRSST